MQLVLSLIVVISGCAVALQGVFNSRLRVQWDLGFAAMVNSIVASVTGFLFWLSTGAHFPSRERLLGISPVLLSGGVCGSFIVITGAYVFGRLPVALAMALSIFGQFAAGLWIDANGFLGMPQVPVTPGRLAGVALILAGALLVRRG